MSAILEIERKSIELQLFDHYLRTGRRVDVNDLIAAIERKYNHNHDQIGRFTFSTGASGISGHMPKVTHQPTSKPRSPTIVRAESGRTSGNPMTIRSDEHQTNSDVGMTGSQGRISHHSAVIAPKDLQTRALAIPRGHNELVRLPNMDIVVFGPGVSLVPVEVGSLEGFDTAANLSSRIHSLDAVITGPQFDLNLAGSEALHGQAVIGGRAYGKSAPGLYYFSTVTGRDGAKRLAFGKGDPPKIGGEVGFGGGDPLLIGGQDVPGYNLVWKAHHGVPGKGKNIVAYNSKRNVAAIFVQRDGKAGYKLESVRDYIRNAGFDYALMYDGSRSASLNYRGNQIISPGIDRQILIPLGIGFRSK